MDDYVYGIVLSQRTACFSFQIPKSFWKSGCTFLFSFVLSRCCFFNSCCLVF